MYILILLRTSQYKLVEFPRGSKTILTSFSRIHIIIIIKQLSSGQMRFLN